MKYIVFTISMLYIIMSCSGCSKTEDNSVYDEPVDVRVNEKINELKEVLLSSEHGWKSNYYPNKELLGGFSFVFDFMPNGEVKMVWDINEGVGSGYYSVKAVDGPTLSFDTYSLFSRMTDPEIGANGSGLGGEQELIYQNQSEDGNTIYFKGKISGDPVIFTKANPEDWNEIHLYKEMESTLKETPGVHPFYKVLSVDGGTREYVLVFFEDMRRLYLYYTDENGEYKEFNIGIHFTAEGFELFEPIEMGGGKMVSSFRFDAENMQYIVEDESVNGSITFREEPPTNFANAANLYFTSAFLYSSFNSTQLTALIDPMSEIGDFNYFYMQAYNGRQDYEEISVTFKDFSSFTFNIANYEEIGEDKIVMHYGSFSSWYYDESIMENEGIKALYDLLFDPAGWTVVPITKEEFGRRCYLVSNRDPSVYIRFDNDIFE